MTLTNRLLLFLILSHAVLLVGFSVAVYAVARAQLHRQLDERNEAALDTLAATAELEDDGWEWEHRVHRIGRAGGAETPAWVVFDDGDHRLDGSAEPIPEGWRTARRVFAHPHPEKVPTVFDPEKPRYRGLVFVAASSPQSVESLLATLAGSLAGGTAALIALVALGGRRWCRRALAPVARMTAAVTGIGAESLAERVPEPGPRDELRELAEAFNALLTRVQLGYERQARFTAEASHQLRTPLAGMLGQLELALKRERTGEDYRRAIALAIAQVGHLNQIVDMLLFLARADADAQIAIPEPVDLAGVIRVQLETQWSTHSRFADIDLAGSGGILLNTQPALLGQAFHNVLENAIKYSDPGTPIAIRIAPTEGAVEISIRDCGCGIAAGEFDRIFAPFYRTADATRAATRGVGLGLAVARRIVESLGGSIRVESEPRRGSTFTIRLPLKSPSTP